jgi:hypothetical protein
MENSKKTTKVSVQSHYLGPPSPTPLGECFSPQGGATLAREGGGGGPKSYDCTETLVLYIYYSILTLRADTKYSRIFFQFALFKLILKICVRNKEKRNTFSLLKGLSHEMD